MTLNAWIEIWLETYVEPLRAANTAKGYRYALARLSPSFLAQELSAITAIDCQREINRMAATTPRQAQIALVGLRQALKRAVRTGYAPLNPIAEIEAPVSEKKDICYLTPEQLIALLREAAPLPAFRAIACMSLLGLRRGEALGLRYGDIRDGHVHITQQLDAAGNLVPLKTKASRRVLPLTEDLQELLGNGCESDFVCRVTMRRLYADLKTALSAADLPHVTPHGLRHTYATLAIHEGVSMRILQSLLGHAHFGVTADTYAHVYRPDLDAAGRQISERITPHMAVRLYA